MTAASDGTAVVAVDFGASSIRVCRVDLGQRPPELEVVHRYRHGPIADASGHLRWDWERLMAELDKGLGGALERGPVASIGVDTWGVDYGLLDHRGELVAPPFSYRDARTDGWSAVVKRIGDDRLYAVTGVQFLPFNTIFQVASHDQGELARARHLLMLPELIVHHLTGAIVAEPTSAGTTALVDIHSGEWSPELAQAVGLDQALLAPIAPAGTCVGRWHGIPVHLVGGHDTASAVVAMGAHPGRTSAFVSSGTWMIVGRERPTPDLSDDARRANFSNERGAFGSIRFLKNLAGSWLLEGCRAAWGDPPIDDLLAVAAQLPSGPVVDVADTRFLHPDDMLDEVTSAAGLPRDTSPVVVTRCIVDSMAEGTARVLDELTQVPRGVLWTEVVAEQPSRYTVANATNGSGPSGPTSRPDQETSGRPSDQAVTRRALAEPVLTEVYVFGGGSRSALYRRTLAERTGLPVYAGPVEATALGNALVQGIALGVYAGLDDARASLADKGDEGRAAETDDEG
jgi:rhamnulokinase